MFAVSASRDDCLTMNTEYEIEQDIALSEFIEEISEQAIGEFKLDCLCSYYYENPMVMGHAVNVLQEGKELLKENHPAAALVFFVTSIELLLKATILQPVVKGLVHNAKFAEIIMMHTLGQSGFDRYKELLGLIYKELAGLDLSTVQRNGAKDPLLKECTELQKIRNSIIHKGESCSSEIAEKALDVSVAVYNLIVVAVLDSLQLTVVELGKILPKTSKYPSPF
ncbi:hypothetical protein [Methylomonas albis]|uniref:RiboL-PSP-HEPN domain-containing protein n=1 Tax=Methylomonas albis TaxID=1854563 RepID=A0ABR9D433_9GAMM|nr:hypothetical protein [Methylomonas albis]MBD9357873.1 hypothetical protein [Methylomonas albis]CAD6881206.1 hypothetical protein [Methylomonas albis]